MSSEALTLTVFRHELRTALNHILGYCEIVLEAAETPGVQKLRADVIQLTEQGRRFVRLLDSLWDELSPAATAETRARARRALVRAAGEVAKQAEHLGRQGAAGDPEIDGSVTRILEAAHHLVEFAQRRIVFSSERDAARPKIAEEPHRVVPEASGSAEILIVDDDVENLTMLSRVLGRQGYQVHCAVSGEEALKRLRESKTDLVLLDVIMPGLDGYETLKQIKSDPALSEVPVLMISSLGEIESTAECIRRGADDYLTKPFEPSLLRARIGACLEKVRLREREHRHLEELAELNRTLERRVQEQVSQVERLGRLRRFFAPQLAELILSGEAADPLKSHRREITVVFVDLRGFTAFAETAEPEEVMGVLREFHAAMGALILEHEGALERFTGDGMMILFNDPAPVSDPDYRAAKMSVAMRNDVSDMKVRWRKRGYALGLGIGIARGYATIGAIGFEERVDYSAIGTVCNLAARLCGEAKDGQVLISAKVASELEGLAELEDVGDLVLKGLARPVRTFNLLSLRQGQGE